METNVEVPQELEIELQCDPATRTPRSPCPPRELLTRGSLLLLCSHQLGDRSQLAVCQLVCINYKKSRLLQERWVEK